MRESGLGHGRPVPRSTWTCESGLASQQSGQSDCPGQVTPLAGPELSGPAT